MNRCKTNLESKANKTCFLSVESKGQEELNGIIQIIVLKDWMEDRATF